MTEYALDSGISQFSIWQSRVSSWLRYRNLAIGGCIVLVLLLTGLLAPLLAPHNPYQQNLSITFQSPGAAHLFGSPGREEMPADGYGARATGCPRAVRAGIRSPVMKSAGQGASATRGPCRS